MTNPKIITKQTNLRIKKQTTAKYQKSTLIKTRHEATTYNSYVERIYKNLLKE